MYNTISLFSGVMGLDLGLELAGFSTRVCVENDGRCCQSIQLNRPEIPVIKQDIQKLTTQEVLEVAGLSREGSILSCV